MTTAKVYYLPLPDNVSPEEQGQALKALWDKTGAGYRIGAKDFVAIKLHVGEKHNTTHLQPAVIKAVVDCVKACGGWPFLTETSTLYKGERENAVKHLLHAQAHGFGIEQVGAPFIMADGLVGDSEHEVRIDGELHERVQVARGVVSADALVVVSHPTGHIAAGYGGCIKNLGMGLASRKGKMRQHAAMKPAVRPEKCVLCRKCIQWCPEKAIEECEGKARIVAERCIGCGECLAVCRFDAVKSDWGAESGYMQRSMAEHAYGVVKGKEQKSVFINVLVNMTKDCDCFDTKQEKCMPDLGLLLSADPVALDMATLDLTAKDHGKNLAQLAYEHHDALVQLRHAAKVGLGQLEYQLITIGE